MIPICVLLEEPAPRARQAVEWTLGSILGLDVRWADSPEALAAFDGPRLAYGAKGVAGAFHIAASGWLNAKGTSPYDPTMGSVGGVPILFPTDRGDLPFDVFAAIFFLLSRFEEWTGLPADAHGRPLTSSFHAALNGYLHRPIVDEWALMLAEHWSRSDPAFRSPERHYKQVITVDLDNGFKYLGRPLWRTLGSAARDLLRGAWGEVGERMSVLRGAEADPFMIDPQLKVSFDHAADRTAFFVLAAHRGEWDHAVPVEHPGYAATLRELSSWAEVGIHPSYYTSDRPGLAVNELHVLQTSLHRPVTISRQHFLRLKLPDTFRELEGMGIREDHSMGLHDRIGFRCGTCTPYPWYDLQHERSTALMIHPFTVMDNALRDKMKLVPEEAADAVRPVLDAVKRVRGTFTGLWHESFLARSGPHVGWRHAILRIIQEARA